MVDALKSSEAARALDKYRRTDAEELSKKEHNGNLTQEDFFALLSQELAHQDPTKPVDNNEMISQMTAFSTTNGVEELNKQFTDFSLSMSSNQALQASSLVGQSVLVDDSTFGLEEGKNAKGKLVTDEPASNVVIYVENASGQLIQTVPVGQVDKGSHSFIWDGKNSDGENAPEGAYQYHIVGLVEGEAFELQAMTYRKVDSVNLSGSDGVVLNLNGGSSMKLADIVEVSDG